MLLAQSAPSPTTGAVISRMFDRYNKADSLSGTVVFTQTAQGRTVTIDSQIQYDRPTQFYLRQVQRGQSRPNLTIADGKMFTYEVPRNLNAKPGDRLYEPQNQRGVVYNVSDIYTIALESLLDRSAVFDILIAKPEHLRFVAGQLATRSFLNDNPPSAGQSAVIVGRWRDYANAEPTGTYAIAISPQGDLQRFAITQNLNVAGQTVEVRSEWTLQIKVGDPGDAALYRVVR